MTDALTVIAPDGRTLAYAESGNPAGPPLFLFHGTPGSRLDHDPFDNPTAAHIITIDRPGYGQSSPFPGRRLIDWPADVVAVADALGIDRFTVMGISGGGPHALVCAALIPHRLHRVGVVCGVGPLHEPWTDEGSNAQNTALANVARDNPAALTEIGAMIADAVQAAPDAGAFFGTPAPDMPAVDVATLAIPEVQAMIFASTREAMRQGGEGFAEENRMLAEPWGFDLGAITVEVRFIQGTDDTNVPPSHATFLAGAIPGAALTLLQGEGHMSLAMRHAPRDSVRHGTARLARPGAGTRRRAGREGSGRPRANVNDASQHLGATE
ncbi:MAG: alpha/beta hydrolase [Actinomycetota bacterium]